MKLRILSLSLCLLATHRSFAQSADSPRRITTPKEAIGFNMGDDYMMANYTQATAYIKKLATESDRMKLVDLGPTAEGRRQYMVIVTSPENLAKLDHYKEISAKLALPSPCLGAVVLIRVAGVNNAPLPAPTGFIAATGLVKDAHDD